MCLISPNEHVGVGSRFVARIGAGDSMRNTAVRLGFEGRNREGGGCVWMAEVWVQVRFSLIAGFGARV